MGKNTIAINIVVAMAENRVIGRDNQLPWRLPKDLAYFKQVTWGHPILMGRRTFESIGRPLPGRRNMVLSRQTDWTAENVEVVPSVDAAVTLLAGVQQLMVIGGAEVYRQCLPLADKLYITQVHSEIEGDAFFPELDEQDWLQISLDEHYADDTNPFNYSFVVYQRILQ